MEEGIAVFEVTCDLQQKAVSEYARKLGGQQFNLFEKIEQVRKCLNKEDLKRCQKCKVKAGCWLYYL